jgi:tricorn protease
MRSLAAVLCALLLVPVVTAAPLQEPPLTRLLRYPDVSRDKIAFVYAGDVWVVERAGGTARRLTSGMGEELFPRFSPDGRWIAFTGQYSGTRQVYVITIDGGEPRQLTYYNDVGDMPPRGGIDNQVMDWSPDGRYVLFNAHRLPWSDRMARPYVVPVDGGMERPLVVPEGGTGMYSPDGKKYVYAPISREFRTWKRYRGGRNSDLWLYDLEANTSEPIVESPYTDQLPSWVGDTIYFASDREGGKGNLWAYETKSRQTRRVTNHADFDVLWPSAGPDAVVYENGGYVYLYDTAKGKSERVPIRVYGDFAGTVPYFEKVKDNIQNGDVSPTGVRAVFEARGDIFTVPAKEGEPRNISNSQGVRERGVAWSPDGRWISYLSDRTGEYEIYLRRQDGSGDERKLTTGLDAWTFTPAWSPDSKKLAFGDKKQRLRILDVESGKISDADRSTRNDITTYVWSPDSRWIAYTKTAETQYSTIWLYSLDSNRAAQLTSSLTSDANPVWDPKGRYLYFTSNRDFNLTFSNFEFNYIYTNPTRVYVGILAKDGPALFLPTSDEEKPKETPPPPQPAGERPQQPAAAPQQTPPAAQNGDKQVEVTPPPAPAMKVDFEGFEQRVRAIPGPPGNYGNLAATDSGVLYATGAPGAPPRVELYNVEAKEKQPILEGTANFTISADRKTILFQGGNGYGILPLKPGQKATDGQLALDKLDMKVDPRLEWRQMYVDAWRILRDWFYDPNMHGNDWNAVRARYEPLVDFVATRGDLDFIFGELAGELNAGHAYVSPGESRFVVERVDSGLLGADIAADPSGYFKIEKIYPGENWHADFRSPLTEPGVNVKTGDFILAVDGRSTKSVKNFYELMEAKADQVVTLTVNSRPDPSGAREERVRPITKETNLRYLDWVLSRREMVEKLSGGRIGYIHLPNTAVEGNRELFKYFYPQSNKDALLIDDRYNGGGFIPDRMIELLDRPVLNYWSQRGLEPGSTPAFSHSGPKLVLVNGYSSSGGDAFPYYFRKRGLGKIVGTRTWGGLIGISGNPALVDGGNISAPRFRFLDTEGKWDVEGVGVAPDVEVVDRPEAVAKGHDPSLERGVQMLMQELEAHPPNRIRIPAVTVNR